MSGTDQKMDAKTTIIEEFTEDGKRNIVSRFISEKMPVSEFMLPKHEKLVRKLFEVRQKDQDDAAFGFMIQHAIVLQMVFGVSNPDVVRFARDNQLFEQLFKKIKASAWFETLMAEAEWVYVTADSDGNFKPTTIN